MTRFGVLGDIHCEDVALAAALGLFWREGVERVLAVGDIVDGPGDPQRTLELIQQGVDAVAGNHDHWFRRGSARDMRDATQSSALLPEQRGFLARLPKTRTYETPHGSLLLCHGLGEDDMATLKPDDFGYGLENNDALAQLLSHAEHRFVVSGHSHQRMVRKLEGTTFINAGTLLRGHEPCVLVLDVGALTATFFDWKDGGFTRCDPALPLP